MSTSSPVTSHVVLRGVPVVGGVQCAPVIRPGRLPVVDAPAGDVEESAREAEATRFSTAAATVANRLRDRAGRATDDGTLILTGSEGRTVVLRQVI